MLEISCKTDSIFEESPFLDYGVLGYLLKRNNDLAQGLVCSVFDSVPMERLQILFSGL